MRKWIVLGVVLAGLATVATTFLLARRLNSYLDENRHRIARETGATLGRTVAFEDMRVSFGSGLGVRIDDLRIAEDPRLGEADFVRIGRLHARIRLLPVLLGRFEMATLTLEKPDVTVIETASGFNFDSFGKRVEPIDASAPARRAAPAETRNDPVLRVPPPRLDKLLIRGARVRYVDRRRTPESRIEVADLDLEASGVGGDRASAITLTAALFGSAQKNLDLSGKLGPLGPSADTKHLDVDLDVDLGPIAIDDLKSLRFAADLLPAELHSRDPVRVRARAKGNLDEVALETSIDAAKAAIRYGEVFDKPAGTPLALEFRGVRKGTALAVEQAELKVATLAVTARGTVKTGAAASVDLHLELPPTELAEWQKLLPVLADLELRGRTEARLHASGPVGESRVPFLKGTIELADVALGGVPGRPRIEKLSSVMQLDGDLLTLPETTFAIGGSPVTVRATGRNLARPIIDFTARAAEVRPAALGLDAGDGADLLRDVTVQGRARLADSELEAEIDSAAGRILGIDYEDLDADAAMDDGVVHLRRMELAAFGGTFAVKGLVHATAAPLFDLRLSADGVLIGALLASRGSPAATAIEGRLGADLELRGVAGSWTSVGETIQGTGHFTVENGVLKDMNVGAAVLGGLTAYGGLGALASPGLHAKYPHLFGTGDTRFDEIAATATINGARMETTDLALRAPDYSVRAGGVLDLDRRIDLKARLVLSEGLSADLASDVREVRYLTNDARRLEVPFRLAGTFPEARPEPDSEPITRALDRALLDRGAGRLFVGEKDGETSPERIEEGLRQLFGR